MAVAFIHNRLRYGKTAEVALGVLCAVAVLAAMIVGLYAHFTSLRQYWRLGQGASFFNVLPTERAAGKADATSLVFTNETRVDVSKTYGFVDGNSPTGTIYCVAPVSSGLADVEQRTQFWAAGLDCCYPRSDFHCGQAGNPDAHGALVFNSYERAAPEWDLAVNGAQTAWG